MAVFGLVAATVFASTFLKVSLPVRKLYIVAGAVVVYNFLLFDLIRYMTWGSRQVSPKAISHIIGFQVAADLVILTAILHFSGGIENPFFLYFVFHMVLTGVMLPRGESYVVATLAMLLFGGMVWLEYKGIVAHYTLTGFVRHSHYQDGLYVLGTLFILASTLYLVTYMTTSISDQLRKQQEEYERANAQLQMKDHLKNEYVLRLTHDIRGHLAAIETCLDASLNHLGEPLSDGHRDLSERAYRRAGKCMAFVDALLKLTRMKLTGRIDMHSFPLKNVVIDSLAAAEERANEKHIQVSYDIADSIDELYGEPVLIGETITNLLFNSVRYTPEGGSIRLVVRDQGDGILVEIADTGIGIPPGEEEKIFEEFHRASNAREVESHGTGLGLSIASQVVQRHGGRIWARNNTDGPGSTFSFYIPRGSGGNTVGANSSPKA